MTELFLHGQTHTGSTIEQRQKHTEQTNTHRETGGATPAPSRTTKEELFDIKFEQTAVKSGAENAREKQENQGNNTQRDRKDQTETHLLTEASLYNEYELRQIMSELRSASGSARELSANWKTIMNSTDFVERIDRLVANPNIEETIKECIAQWQHTRNLTFLTYLKRKIATGIQRGEIIKLINMYTQLFTIPRHINIDDWKTTKDQPLLFTMVFTHPTYWPNLCPTKIEQDRGDLYTKEIIQYMRTKEAYISLPIEIEQRYATEIKKDFEQRRDRWIQMCMECGVEETTGNRTWDMTVYELFKEQTAPLPPVLDPFIDETGKKHDMIILRYDVTTELQDLTLLQRQANSRKIEIMRRQIQEQCRLAGLASKMTIEREEEPEYFTMGEPSIRWRAINLKMGKPETQDIINTGTTEEKAIALLASQWNADRNYAWWLNIKAGICKEQSFNFRKCVDRIARYKNAIANRNILRNVEIPVTYSIIMAMIASHPNNWPATNNTELMAKRKDPKYKQCEKIFGPNAAAIGQIYGGLLQWSPEENAEEVTRLYRERTAQIEQQFHEANSWCPKELTVWGMIMTDLIEKKDLTWWKAYLYSPGSTHKLTITPHSPWIAKSQEDTADKKEKQVSQILNHIRQGIAQIWAINNQSETRAPMNSPPSSESSSNSEPELTPGDLDSLSEMAPTDRSNSTETSPEPSEPSDDSEEAEMGEGQRFERHLINILKTKRIGQAKEKLLQLMHEHEEHDDTYLEGLQDTVAKLLYMRAGKHWPSTDHCRCPVHAYCDYRGETPGKLRNHMSKAHKLDTTRVRDDIHISLEYLLERQITPVIVRSTGETILMNPENPAKAPLKCHFCDFTTARDDTRNEHWDLRHRKEKADMAEIGLFWARMRQFAQLNNRLPSLKELLREEELLRCQACGLISYSSENIIQHLRKKHDIQDPSRFDEVHYTYTLEPLQGQDMVQQTQPVPQGHFRAPHGPVVHVHNHANQHFHNHQHLHIRPGNQPAERRTPTHTESEEEGTFECTPVEPQKIETQEEHYRELEEMGISRSAIRRALRTESKDVFKQMLKVTLRNKPELIVVFVEIMKEVKSARNQTINLQNDIGDLLWKVAGKDWPTLNREHWCACCDTHYSDRTTYLRHRHSHTTNIQDVDALKDWIRLHIPPTTRTAVSHAKAMSLTRPVQKCEVPGCSFYFERIGDYLRHLDRQLNNEKHLEYITAINECGQFYGTLKMLTSKLNRLPTLNELLGNDARQVNLCSTCFEAIPSAHDVVQKHYEEKLHAKKRGPWSFAAKIIESLVNRNEQITQIEALLQADHRELSRLLEELQTRMMADAAETFDDPESQERDRIAAEAVEREEEARERNLPRISAEIVHRTQLRAQGLSDEEIRRRWEETRNRNPRNTQEEEEHNTTSSSSTEAPDRERNETTEPSSHYYSSSSSEDEGDSIEEPAQGEEIREETRQNRQPHTAAERGNLIRAIGDILRRGRPPAEEEEHERRKWNKARDWRQAGIENEKKGYQMPKMTRQNRAQVREGLRDLWSKEILPLIREYLPEENNDEQWLGFEGAIYKMEDLLRKHAITKMGRTENSMYRKPPRNYVNQEREENVREELKIRRVRKVADIMEELRDNYEAHHEAGTRKAVQKITKRVTQLSPEERRRWWKTEEIAEILQEIERHVYDAEAYGHWLETTIIAATAELEQRKNATRNSTRLQEEYSDNANRTMRNLIWKEERPECKIETTQMIEYTKNNMSKDNIQEAPDTMAMFKSPIAINDEREAEDSMYNYLTDKMNIARAITSRQWNSAPGVDGLDYTLYKEGGKEAVETLQLIIQTILKHKRAPIQFKTSRTVYIYKKGDEKIPANWRPLTISNAMYRIVMVLMSRYIMEVNKTFDLLNDAQKGFVEGINGTAEHILTLTELFNDAERKHKSLYIVALDFQNAFGSVNHDHLYRVLEQKGLPKTFTDIIRSIYDASTTRLDMGGVMTETIDMKKGMKQGCPLSPLLFNMAIDPLIRVLDSRTEWGYKVGGDSFTVQAYADDIMLISNSESNMNKLIKIVHQFTQISGTKLAPAKCQAYIYAMNSSQRRIYTGDIRINDTPIKITPKEDTIRYLGAPIASHRNERMQNTKITEAHFMELLEKIMTSKLAIVQKIHATKIFLLPKLEYEMTTSQVRAHMLQHIDQRIRASLNKLIGAKLPKAAYHASWKDGGMGISSVIDRQQVAQLRAFLCMITSKHQKIQNLMKKALKDERKFRKIPEGNNGLFLNWSPTPERPIEHTKGTSSLAAKACKVCNQLKIKMKEEEDPDQVELNISILDTVIPIRHQSNANKALLHLMREKWKEELCKDTFHLHTFQSLRDNNLSTAFMNRIQNPAKDSFFKFVCKARTNTLPTKEFIAIMQGRESPKCSKCHENINESLQHILNGCAANVRLIMDRHNAIARYINDEMRKTYSELKYSALDATIQEVDIQENRRLKPDIQLWNENRTKVILVEINVPYATQWQGQHSLEEKYNIKVEKYRDLTRELRARGVRTELFVIVVSSLGALYKESQSAIFRMFTDEKKAKSICRMISGMALNGSYKIWKEHAIGEMRQVDNQHEEHDSARNSDREAEVEDAVDILQETEEQESAPETPEEREEWAEDEADDTESDDTEERILTNPELLALFTDHESEEEE